MSKYPNYDLTYSFSGYNMLQSLELLSENKGRVAMVFEGKQLPTTFMGYKVIDGDEYDMRRQCVGVYNSNSTSFTRISI